MRVLFLILFSLVSSIAEAQSLGMGVDYQNVDSVRYWVIYRDKFYPYEEKSRMYEEYRVLVVGDSISNFTGLTNWYPEYFFDIKDDPALASRESWMDMKDMLFRHDYMSKDRRIQYLFKGYPDRSSLRYCEYIFIPPLYYDEEMPQMEWSVEEGDSTIIGYKCFKAKTTFRERTWTVWYTLDIPISDGPWKLCGLPGMILHAEESTGHRTYTAVACGKPDKPMVIDFAKNMDMKSNRLEIYRLARKQVKEKYRMMKENNMLRDDDEVPGDLWMIER